MIKVAALTKVFKTFDRREGLSGAVALLLVVRACSRTVAGDSQVRNIGEMNAVVGQQRQTVAQG